MAMFTIAKNLFRRFLSCSSRQAIIGNQSNSSCIFTHFDSRLDSKHRGYGSSSEKWITIILEKENGTQLKRKAKIGDSLLDALYNDADIPDYGVCGGAQNCSTCHVIFTKEDFDIVKKYNTEEDRELDCLDGIAAKLSPGLADMPTDTSRLGCCIILVPEMDGMVIKLAKTQSIDPNDEN